jgi:hypothetical protein
MTNYQPDRDWTATQAAPWRTASPDVATMAAYFPVTSARPAASVTQPVASGVRTGLRPALHGAGVVGRAA